MHVGKIITQLLSKVIHKARIQSLIPVINAIITSKQLKLTPLGRSLNTPGKERAAIRRIDRLLANSYYQKESIDIYKAITRTVIGNKKRPTILVDWTGLPNSRTTTKGGEQCCIRASIAAEGRSVTLYEEVHSKKKESNGKVHDAFLKKLKSILPEGCCPYIVTDAGFRTKWFEAVQKLGWDYIGRLRGRINYHDGKKWRAIKTIFKKIKINSPTFFGEITLGKASKLETKLYTYKHKLKGRTKKLKSTGKKDKREDPRSHARGYREPWLIVSSISGASAAKLVIEKYKYRMTIESSFRDTKSEEFGFGLRENKTIKKERYNVWLMLAALASLIAWIIGYVAEEKGLHYAFQANTYRHRRVLSFFYLGCQIVRKKIEFPISLNEVRKTAWGMI